MNFDLVMFLYNYYTASPAISGPSLSSTSLVVSSASLVVPTTSSAPTSVHSDPASPNDCDDDSFADFVAKEALTNALEDHSHSPTPNPSHLSLQSSSGSSDIHALLNHLHRQSPAAEGSSALISQFGVTASCPPTPVQLPEGAVPAVRHNYNKYYMYTYTMHWFFTCVIFPRLNAGFNKH